MEHAIKFLENEINYASEHYKKLLGVKQRRQADLDMATADFVRAHERYVHLRDALAVLQQHQADARNKPQPASGSPASRGPLGLD